MLIFVAEKEDCAKRLDIFLSEAADITRSNAQKLLEDNCVLVNGKNENKKYKMKENDEVQVSMPEPRLVDAKPQDIPLHIVYEDDDIIIVNKPQGMVVHPAAGNYDGTLVNALMFHTNGNLSAINGVIRPGIVHRIDKDTSGILVVAKNDTAHLSLSEQIEKHSMTREYVCLIHGGVKEDNFTVDKPIGRDTRDRKKMLAGARDGKSAITHFSVLRRYQGYTLLKCVLETGRTHQIRAHLKSVGKAIVGDLVYGLKKDILAQRYGVCGQLLHAKKLGFIHPGKKEYVEFDSQLPEKFLCILNKLEDDK